MFSIDEILLKRLSRKTGFPVKLGRANSSLLTGRFHVEDLEIGNPDNFPQPDFVSIVRASAQVAPGSLLRKRIDVRELSFHLRMLTGIRTAAGDVNIERFRNGLERRDPAEPGRGGLASGIRIKRLSVRVDRVVTIDYSRAGVSRSEYPVCFEREFRDVDDLVSLGPVLVRHCGSFGLSRSADAIFATLLPDFLWARIGVGSG